MNSSDLALKTERNDEKTEQRNGTPRARWKSELRSVPISVPFRPAGVPIVSEIDLLEAAEAQLKAVGGEAWQWSFAIGIRRHVNRGFPISEKQVNALLAFVILAKEPA